MTIRSLIMGLSSNQRVRVNATNATPIQASPCNSATSSESRPKEQLDTALSPVLGLYQDEKSKIDAIDIAETTAKFAMYYAQSTSFQQKQ